MSPQRHQIVRLPRVSSTQEIARERARAGCPSGLVVLAEEQTKGRGRGGRMWESVAGLGLYMSLVHRTGRPVPESPAIPLIAALGVGRTFAAAGIDPRLKWPNDVWLNGRKAAGVLGDAEDGAVIVGIGVNLLQNEADFSPPLRSTATSLAIERRRAGLEPIDREAFLDALLDALAPLLAEFEGAGPARLLPSIWERSVVRDRDVAVVLPSGEAVRGTAVGLGPVGELRVRSGERIWTISAGTLTVADAM